jgi:glutamyl-tRNA synthetase
LFSWLFARHHGGSFILRIEDTDRERSTDESVQAILDGMSWLGLDADEGPFFQTQRFDRYREVIQQLLDTGHAYHCYSTPEELDAMREAARARGDKPRYDGTWRDSTATPPEGVEPVIRFRNPESGAVVIADAVKGEISIDNSELDDLVIQRSDGSPTYNLSVVVDDMDMNITHVIRGDDHVNNTPRQINILSALGAPLPVYAHLPMILGEDGKRMSKRHGAVSVTQYRDDGYLPEALLNYLVRLGWSHGDEEFFPVEQMTELFSLEGVNRSGSVFDRKKLDSISQQHIQTAPAERLAEVLGPLLPSRGIDVASGPPLAGVADALRERAKTLVDMADTLSYFYRAPTSYDEKAAAKQFTQASSVLMQSLRQRLVDVNDWDATSIQEAIQQTVDEADVGFGKVGQPLRLAITGVTASPAMNEVMAMLSRDDVLARIDQMIAQASAD